MGVLTEDITRLRDDIVASRGARETLMQDLASETRELARDVSAMLKDFHHSHAQIAQETRAACMACVRTVQTTVKGLRHRVLGLRRSFAADMRGARLAWAGKAPRAAGQRRPMAGRTSKRKRA